MIYRTLRENLIFTHTLVKIENMEEEVTKLPYLLYIKRHLDNIENMIKKNYKFR